MNRNNLRKYKIYDKILFDKLGQSEFFERMEELSIQFYQTGSPHPDTIKTETYLEDNG